MSNQIQSSKNDYIKEVKGVKYFKLISPYPFDYTKNCGLLSSEVDENFFFLRGYDVESAEFNDNNELVLTRVNGDVITAALPDLPENLTFEFNKDTGELIITYPDGTVKVLDGFYVAGDDLKVATDYTIRGDGRVYNPLRISGLEKTGTYAPVSYFLDRTEGEVMPDGTKLPKGYRILTKERFSPFGLLYTFGGVRQIKSHLEETLSPWRIPTRKDWADLLNAAEYCERDRNHDTFEVNELTGKIAGARAKSVSSWIPDEHGVVLSSDNLPADGGNKTFHVIPLGYGEGSRGYITEESDSDVEGVTKIASFWTDTETGSHFESNIANIFTRSFVFDSEKVLQESSKPSSRLSLRLVKDYDYEHTEFEEYDNIFGETIPTILITNPETKYSKIWTSVNVGFDNPVFSGVSSSEWNVLSGEDREVKEAYFTNEWNGVEWIKKEMRIGDSVVVLDFDNSGATSGDTYHEYRVYLKEDGTPDLIDTSEALKREFQKEIDELHEEIDIISGTVNEFSAATVEEIARLDTNINTISGTVNEFSAATVEEIARLDTDINTISGTVNEFSAATVEEIARLDGRVDTETERATAAEESISGTVNEFSASTVEEIARLDGKDLIEDGSSASVLDGLTLQRENGETINLELNTDFGTLPNYE